MTRKAKRKACWWAALLLLLAALYAALGILQAGSIYGAERGLSNLRFWGGIMAASLPGSALFAFYAVRLGRSVK